MNTLKSYQDAIVLYLSFLEDEKKVRSDSLSADCFRHTVIEEWLVWLREARGCSPGSCNNRLASLRTFLKYLGSRDVAYLHFYLEAARSAQEMPEKESEGLTREAVKALMDALTL